jgi:hypothetical protein
MIKKLTSTLILATSLLAGVVGASEAAASPSQSTRTLQQGAFVKDGLEHLRHLQYQYECLGLGGTVMRVGTDGFASPAPGIIAPCRLN